MRVSFVVPCLAGFPESLQGNDFPLEGSIHLWSTFFQWGLQRLEAGPALSEISADSFPSPPCHWT